MTDLNIENAFYHAILLGGCFDLPEPMIMPLGISFLAAYCRQHNKKIKLLNPYIRSLNPEQTAREILTQNFLILGISIHCGQKKELLNFIKVARIVKEKKKPPGGGLPTLAKAQAA